MAEAKRLLELGNSANARELLLTLARENPRAADTPEALFLAATANPNLPEARAEFGRLALDHPLSEQAPPALAHVGELSFILGEYGASVTAFKAYRKFETDPRRRRDVDIRLAMALLRSGQYEEALSEFEAIRTKYTDLAGVPELMESRADALLGLGRLEEADALLQKVETGFPNYGFAVKVLFGRGLCAELLGRTSDARRIYREIGSQHAGSIEASLAADRLADIEIPLVPPN